MAIWLNEDSRIIVQGMTGSEGRKHTARMLACGAKVVGGVTPRKGGQSVDFDGVFQTLEDEGVDKFINAWTDLIATTARVMTGL